MHVHPLLQHTEPSVGGQVLVAVDPTRGFIVRGIAEGLSHDELQAATDAPLIYADDVMVLTEN